MPPWHRFGAFLRRRFGRPVRRLPLDAGFSCPHAGGCAFCDNAAFVPGFDREAPRRLLAPERIAAQVRSACDRLPEGTGAIAYFQAATNTAAPVAVLGPLYEAALADPRVVGLAVGTRPDCVDDAVADLLARLAERTWVQLELGLPSADDRTLARLGRGHGVEAFLRAMRLCRGRGLEVCGHLIAWLPGEGPEAALRTAETMRDEGVSGVKLHHLHLIRGTRLAAEYEAAPFFLPSFEEHAALAADLIERLPWRITVQRLAGAAPAELTVAPAWTAEAGRIPARVEEVLRRRGTQQGARCAQEEPTRSQT